MNIHHMSKSISEESVANNCAERRPLPIRQPLISWLSPTLQDSRASTVFPLCVMLTCTAHQEVGSRICRATPL